MRSGTWPACHSRGGPRSDQQPVKLIYLVSIMFRERGVMTYRAHLTKSMEHVKKQNPTMWVRLVGAAAAWDGPSQVAAPLWTSRPCCHLQWLVWSSSTFSWSPNCSNCCTSHWYGVRSSLITGQNTLVNPRSSTYCLSRTKVNYVCKAHDSIITCIERDITRLQLLRKWLHHGPIVGCIVHSNVSHLEWMSMHQSQEEYWHLTLRVTPALSRRRRTIFASDLLVWSLQTWWKATRAVLSHKAEVPLTLAIQWAVIAKYNRRGLLDHISIVKETCPTAAWIWKKKK